MGLYYSNESNLEIIGYLDARYYSDQHKARS